MNYERFDLLVTRAHDRPVPRVNQVIQVGMTAPAFDLPDPWGARVRLESLVSEGPLILSFHRGTW